LITVITIIAIRLVLAVVTVVTSVTWFTVDTVFAGHTWPAGDTVITISTSFTEASWGAWSSLWHLAVARAAFMSIVHIHT
jgi:hypothetical protein